MQFKKSIIGSLVTLAFASNAFATVNEINVERSKLTENKKSAANFKKKSSNLYIVELKDKAGITKAQEIGELLPSNLSSSGNKYNATTPAMAAYTKALEKKQKQVAESVGNFKIIYSYKHTFNGFSAKLTPAQKTLLESHPDVAGVYEDELQTVNTSNTPAFLGLTGPEGQHTKDIKGEGVIIGIMDTGVIPEHPSFADDGTYSDPADLGWKGICDAGSEAEADTFKCNNKLIGARFFKDSFESSYKIRTELGEFLSPRDADGHGSHTASTAGGNAGVSAKLSGLDAGTVSGIAPRARIAVYKTCWNSDYVNPENNRKERGCFYGDNMAAIDQAIVDGVDVINYSIGGSRTSLVTVAAQAKLRAAQAGVFVAVSAGNSGPEAETVGTPAPWVASVGASSYDGTSVFLGKALEVNSGPLAEKTVLSVPSPIAPDADGLTGDLVAAESIQACDNSDGSNPIAEQESLKGKIALIARGSCAFTEKFSNAQEAGASGIVVYTYENTAPFGMGKGDDDTTEVTIPGVMVSYTDGQALLGGLSETTNVTFTDKAASGETKEVGNKMAGFSSRGPNTASYDIIKPDITAPGLRILAATSNVPMFGTKGESFAYLQGTSMSSPHIAGMAALFKQSNPDWSPAQIKSALMTTARQNVVKEDGTTKADPFDFGSGHAAPVSAMDPGLTYDAKFADYLAFLCGIGEANYVASNGTTCAKLVELGHNTDPSHLNYPSIAVAELIKPESVSRTVTNVTKADSVYTATIEAPAGIEVSVTTYNEDGTKTEDGSLSVKADGKAKYTLNFAKKDGVELNKWLFGSITWSDSAGHAVRSPIAIKALPDVKIEVPPAIAGKMKRGRLTFPVKYLYSGRTSIDFAGLVAPGLMSGTVDKDPDQDFKFLGPGTKYHTFEVPEGTKVVRVVTNDNLVAVDNSDLDLYLYRCVSFSCNRVSSSLNAGSNENITLTNPEPSFGGGGNFYLVFVHGYSTGDQPSTDYNLLGWVAAGKDGQTRVFSSRRAVDGRFNNVTIYNRKLPEGRIYMGAATFLNEDGKAEGTTPITISTIKD